MEEDAGVAADGQSIHMVDEQAAIKVMLNLNDEITLTLYFHPNDAANVSPKKAAIAKNNAPPATSSIPKEDSMRTNGTGTIAVGTILLLLFVRRHAPEYRR